MTRKSPQEKKRLSLLKDRRNTYGENSKASRKAIPRHKKAQRRAVRRIQKQVLGSTRRISDADEELSVRLASHETWVWRKTPDTPLGEVLAKKLKRRAKEGQLSPKVARTRLRSIERRTKR